MIKTGLCYAWSQQVTISNKTQLKHQSFPLSLTHLIEQSPFPHHRSLLTYFPSLLSYLTLYIISPILPKFLPKSLYITSSILPKFLPNFSTSSLLLFHLVLLFMNVWLFTESHHVLINITNILVIQHWGFMCTNHTRDKIPN